MDYQTTVDDTEPRDASAHALAQNMAGIAHDMLRIAELQAKLLTADLRTLRNGIAKGLALWVIAGAVLLAALPTALIGAGYWLADTAQLPTSAGLLWVALGAVVLVAGLALAGWKQFTGQRTALERSKKELENNLAAMKQALSSFSGRGAEE